MLYLKPVLPAMAAKAEQFLAIAPLEWKHVGAELRGQKISQYTHLAQRVDRKAVEAMFMDSKETTGKAETPAPKAGAATPPTISIGDFQKIDLRVARIVSAAFVDGADKLLKLEVDLGESRKQVFAGIRSAYQPVSLVGRLVVVVANLEPRQMRFGVSEGMVLAAGPGGKDIFVVSPDSGAQPGQQVK
jgi:methionyl-tRNA synthetase